MEDGVAELVMTTARDFAQVLDQAVALAGNKARNCLFPKPREQLAFARYITAVEQRDGELDVAGIEPFALFESARGRTKFQPQVPQFLGKATDGIFECVFTAAVAMKKEEVDIGMRKQPAPTESAGGDQCKAFGPFRLGGNDFSPEAKQDRFDDRGALGERNITLASNRKFLLDTRGFRCVQVP